MGVKVVDINKINTDNMYSYMMNVMIDRSVPDVTDGLKPVARRVIYASLMNNNLHNKPFQKCAKIVGVALGNYHPTGDSSIYDALIRMAQPFSINQLLIQAQGNVGSIYGDSPAAMRYVESRLTKFTYDNMLTDINKNAVDFKPNYDETDEEPVTLPSKAPLLLFNGTFGIAAGYMSSIPNYNKSDVCDVTNKLIDNPDMDVKEVSKLLRPDFPTGGTIINVKDVDKAQITGNGAFKIRAKIDTTIDKHGVEKLTITEIPYMTNTGAIITRIKDKIMDKTITGIKSYSNLSTGGKIKIVLVIDKNATASIVESQLYKYTQLESSFTVSMVAIRNKKYKTYNIKSLITEWINYRQETIKRVITFDITKTKYRIHIIEGMLIALKDIDDVIKIIKQSNDINSAKATLIKKYSLSEHQADAIVNMKLRSLSKLEINSLTDERNKLNAKIAEWISIIKDKSKINDIIKSEIEEIKSKYSEPRKTKITNVSNTTIDIEDTIENETCMITFTEQGFVKRIKGLIRSQKRGGTGINIGKTRDGDSTKKIIYANMLDNILTFTNTGRMHLVKVYQLEEAKLSTLGKPLAAYVKLKEGERIETIVCLTNEELNSEKASILFATKNGMFKHSMLNEYTKVGQSGIIAIKLKENDSLLDVKVVDNDNCSVVLSSKKALGCRFALNTINKIGRTTSGVTGMQLSKDDQLVSMNVINSEDEQLAIITSNGLGKLLDVKEIGIKTRGIKGMMIAKLSEGSNLVTTLTINEESEEVLIFSNEKLIKMKVSELPLFKRTTSGNRLISLNDTERVVGMTSY